MHESNKILIADIDKRRDSVKYLCIVTFGGKSCLSFLDSKIIFILSRSRKEQKLNKTQHTARRTPPSRCLNPLFRKTFCYTTKRVRGASLGAACIEFRFEWRRTREMIEFDANLALILSSRRQAHT
jgi:hypothetical protein